MRLRKKVGPAVFSLLASLCGSAAAQVYQTDAAQTPLPQPVSAAEYGLVTNSWAFNEGTQVNLDFDGNDITAQGLFYDDFFPEFENGDAITLDGLFKFRGETLDYVENATTAPGYFAPTCGFQGQILLRGGGCEVALGWYNVEDPNSTTPPPLNQIYPLVPQDTSEELDCQSPLDNGFCPLAWDNHNPRELNKALWTPKIYDTGLITQDPNYKGGYVGFAMLGDPNSVCTANKYSLYGQNKKNADGVPWVTALIYQSTTDAEGFYLAFETLPMSTADWQETGVPFDPTSDGDFNEAVFYVSGLTCAGGGLRCDTGLPGLCSVGRTDCSANGEGEGACRAAVRPRAEVCDNLDNDCNGVVDDDDDLCPDGEVCEQGSCVPSCSNGGSCPDGLTCSEGHCVEPLCDSISCDAGLVCSGGDCVDGCAGVDCPVGTECQLGRCVDPCEGVICAENKICDRGLCVSHCECRGCNDGFSCEDDGRCVEIPNGSGGAPSDGGQGGEGDGSGGAAGEASGGSGGTGNAGGQPNASGSGGKPAEGGTNSASGGDAGATSGADCTPGAQVACACPGSSVSGVQICKQDGSGYGACTGCPSSNESKEESGCGCRAPGRGKGSDAWALTLLLGLAHALRARSRSARRGVN